MKASRIEPLSFIVDKLTDSIQNTISGDRFATDVLPLTQADLRQITKKIGWNFNWKLELSYPDREAFKLTIVSNPTIVQGLLSISVEPDHVYMHLLENAPFNLGQNKLYEGVAGNLVAHACRASFQHGHEGFVSFTAKTKLIEHYQKTLGAYTLGGHRMIIPTSAANALIDKYFKS
jgi:hypothetical protein